MDLMSVLAFIFVATLLVISPGPNGLLIAKSVSVSGKKAGFANIMGFVPAFYIHGTLSIFGISILLVQSAQGFFVFKMIGAAYLCWLGIKSLLSVWYHKPASPDVTQASNTKSVSVFGAFCEGFLTNVLNPKVSMFYLAAFPQFLPHGESALTAYSLVTAHALINVVWFCLVILLLSTISGIARSDAVSKWLNSITGTVFIGFGVKLALLKTTES